MYFSDYFRMSGTTTDKNMREVEFTSASIFLRPGKASEWSGLVQAARPYTCAIVDIETQDENMADRNKLSNSRRTLPLFHNHNLAIPLPHFHTFIFRCLHFQTFTLSRFHCFIFSHFHFHTFTFTLLL